MMDLTPQERWNRCDALCQRLSKLADAAMLAHSRGRSTDPMLESYEAAILHTAANILDLHRTEIEFAAADLNERWAREIENGSYATGPHPVAEALRRLGRSLSEGS